MLGELRNSNYLGIFNFFILDVIGSIVNVANIWNGNDFASIGQLC